MSATWFEAEALAILTRAAPVGRSAAEFGTKERELTALFARLSVSESRELHQRLRVPLPDDTLAIAFGRFVADRRGRLLDFVGDARRRHAGASTQAYAKRITA
ncbi:MAG TPA: hypothetical protein VGM90_36145 [Kofleriaceae bacterium]|jgi:hypothetical protein